MKRIVGFLLCLVLVFGIFGGLYALTNDKEANTNKGQSSQTSINASDDLPNSTPQEDSTINEGFVNGEMRLTDESQFQLNRWYRFYIDKSNPASEAFIVLDLHTADGGFNGGFTEPGQDIEVDLPQVKIGISTQFEGQGYIYWSDNLRLSVDAEVDGGENYFDIYLDENVFTGMGDNETIPDIWFELTEETECLAIGAIGGGYVVMLEDQ